ncbi:AAC(3) family N-acetyltransferase [Bacillus sp. FJAT-49732]|uniref:Aminoglycoside N(3)-acetyltransferase n=1 Tax=Lederbergia citrisecunda TaxID=2833583 RepID=A0A942TQJ6_9BACI|nr:AAC(3) family N-acetyltransferase [Lederbergia citrisecunda]MBS4201895.1 AAC(3) family N-acetyltransferase [Lederbergia citrisecunda]
MHTKESLIEDLYNLGINPEGTLIVHSSYKKIGPVAGRADTVLDAFQEYMNDGLLVFPTHSWSYINTGNPIFSVTDSPSCVGILTELFRKRPNVLRSAHPTHSVAAFGKDAEAFTSGDEYCTTPCARESAWGRLLDRNAQILLVGVDLTKNTFIHGIEEWANIPGRLTDMHKPLQTIMMDGRIIDVPSQRHCGETWSDYFWKVDDILLRRKAMTKGNFGNAETRVCDAGKTTEVLLEMLQDIPDLFSNNDPLDEKTIIKYSYTTQ